MSTGRGWVAMSSDGRFARFKRLEARRGEYHLVWGELDKATVITDADVGDHYKVPESETINIKAWVPANAVETRTVTIIHDNRVARLPPEMPENIRD